MEKFRIGNDLSIFWAILDDDGQPYPLADKKVRLFVTHPRGRMEVTDHMSIENGHVVVWNFQASKQRYLGTYKLTVEIYSSPTTRVLRRDIEEAFSLVSASLYEDVEAGKPDINESGMLTLSSILEVVRVAPIVPEIGENGNWIVDGEDTGQPSRGQAGSAVELAYVSMIVDENMELGFDYVGASGSDRIEFKLNEEGELVATTEKTIAGVVGAEVTVDNGTGTPSAEATIEDAVIKLHFSGLKGEKGDTGATGATGPQGAQGPQGESYDDTEIRNEILNNGVFNVNAFKKTTAVFTLEEAIAAIPSNFRAAARAVSYLGSNGEYELAVFNDASYISGWSNVANWSVIQPKLMNDAIGQILAEQPLGMSRTINELDWHRYITYVAARYVLASSPFQADTTSATIVVCPIKSGQTAWLKFWTDAELSEYGIVGQPYMNLIAEPNVIAGETTSLKSMSWSSANKRGNLTASQDGFVTLCFRFNSEAERTINLPKILKAATIRMDDYGEEYVGYYVSQAIALEDTRELHIGNNLLGEKTMGAGWSESNGILTHSSGTGEVVYDFVTSANTPYIIRLSLTNPAEKKLYITIGNYPKIDVYNGDKDVVIGLISTGGQLKIIPESSWSGSISRISLHSLVSKADAVESITFNCHDVRNAAHDGQLTSFWNVIIGTPTTMAAAENVTRNIAIGYSAAEKLKTGTRNVAIGTFALNQLVAGDRNIAIGADALWYIGQAEDCVAIGKAAMGKMNLTAQYIKSIVLGSYAASNLSKNMDSCVAIGHKSLYTTDNPTDISYATAIGCEAGNYGGTYSTYIGYRAGYSQKGDNNTCVGAETSAYYVTGKEQTLVGYKARAYPANTTPSASNQVEIDNVVAIGANATAEKSNQAVIGNSKITETKVYGDLVVQGSDGVKRRVIFNADGSCSWESL